MNYYRQCVLKKITPNGVITVQTSWIPEQYAYKGNWVSLKQKDGTWDNHWKVSEVGMRIEEEAVLENSQDYKHQRKASDI